MLAETPPLLRTTSLSYSSNERDPALAPRQRSHTLSHPFSATFQQVPEDEIEHFQELRRIALNHLNGEFGNAYSECKGRLEDKIYSLKEKKEKYLAIILKLNEELEKLGEKEEPLALAIIQPPTLKLPPPPPPPPPMSLKPLKAIVVKKNVSSSGKTTQGATIQNTGTFGADLIAEMLKRASAKGSNRVWVWKVNPTFKQKNDPEWLESEIAHLSNLVETLKKRQDAIKSLKKEKSYHKNELLDTSAVEKILKKTDVEIVCANETIEVRARAPDPVTTINQDEVSEQVETKGKDELEDDEWQDLESPKAAAKPVASKDDMLASMFIAEKYPMDLPYKDLLKAIDGYNEEKIKQVKRTLVEVKSWMETSKPKEQENDVRAVLMRGLSKVAKKLKPSGEGSINEEREAKENDVFKQVMAAANGIALQFITDEMERKLTGGKTNYKFSLEKTLHLCTQEQRATYLQKLEESQKDNPSVLKKHRKELQIDFIKKTTEEWPKAEKVARDLLLRHICPITRLRVKSANVDEKKSPLQSIADNCEASEVKAYLEHLKKHPKYKDLLKLYPELELVPPPGIKVKTSTIDNKPAQQDDNEHAPS